MTHPKILWTAEEIKKMNVLIMTKNGLRADKKLMQKQFLDADEVKIDIENRIKKLKEEVKVYDLPEEEHIREQYYAHINELKLLMERLGLR